MERQKLLEQLKKTDFDVIVVAGQSNAEGNGLGNEKLKYKPNGNVYQLFDCNNYRYVETNGAYKLDIVLPVEMDFGIYRERFDMTEKTDKSAFCDTFVELYANKFLKADRKVLLIRGAINGSGFSRNEWGVKGVLYDRLKDMIDFVLSANANNELVALLWHQGEHDATEQPSLNYTERFNYYKSHLEEMLCDFSEKYGGNIPIIAGRYSPILFKTENERYSAVINATDEVFKHIKFGAVVKSNGLKVNCQVVGDNDKYHFDRKSNVKFGKRYFKKYKQLQKRIK